MYVNALTLSLLAFVAPGANAGGQPVKGKTVKANLGLCSAQAECIDFTIKKRDSTGCTLEGNCPIEVCMILDTNKDGCIKEGTISHLCSASDADGCAAYDEDGVTPLTGKGISSDCTLTGLDGTAAFDGKCEPEEGQTKIVMCQEGEPGQTLYWALKDSSVTDFGSYDYTGDFIFENHSTTCSPTIECTGDSGYECASPNNDMFESTRVWKYTIPPNDGGACDLCAPPEQEEDPAVEEAGGKNNLALCSAQKDCIDFTIKKRASTSCALGGECGIEVCLVLDTTKDGCAKEGPISHLCAASDGNGCAAYAADGSPLTGKGDSSDCSLSGMDDAAAFDGKCEPEEDQTKIVMCQEGEPGATLYWALKDSSVTDLSSYDYTGDFTFESDSTTCSPVIECTGDSGLQCADPKNGMFDSTRVWKYTIPMKDGSSCDLCGSSASETTADAVDVPVSDPVEVADAETPVNDPIEVADIETPDSETFYLADDPPTTNGGGSIGLCAAQKDCIDFTIKKRESRCALSGSSCGIEVCMILDTNKASCAKEGPISHLCAASDGDGCAAYDTDGVPLTGKGESSDCTLTGLDDAAAFDGKCEPEEDQTKIVMCQEGEPGATLYWALKDSTVADLGTYDYTGDFTFDGNSTPCSPTIECTGDEELQCADPKNDMYGSTRVWKYTIPMNDGGSCDLCGTNANVSGGDSGFLPDAPFADDSGTIDSDLSDLADDPTTTLEPPTSDPADIPSTVNPPTSVLPPNGGVPAESLESYEAGSQGDPHFKTWRNEHYEYHGQCDMVLVKDPDFADGLGLDVQIRTKLVRFWSYIKSAAIRIGNDVFEIEGSADGPLGEVRYWFNMEYKGAVKNVGGFPLFIHSHGKAKKQVVQIDLSSKYPGSMIEFQIFKEFVKVDFLKPTADAFGNTVGMLGDFKTGKTLARDRATEMHDFRELGNEWQVIPADMMLFHKTELPQFPTKCLEPEDPRGARRRRLEETSVSLEDAEKACADLTDDLDRKDCVYDIIATQDMTMAGAY